MNEGENFNPFRISKFELDLLIHCSQSAANKFVLVFERTDNPKAMEKSCKHQEKYTSYAYVWQVRFGSLWMQKIPWQGEVLKALGDWYTEHDPTNAPEVDSRLAVMA